MKDYDVITIGAGGGAYPAAFRLAKSGLSVLMVDEKGLLSGNCLSEGCVPSKAIIETVHTYKRILGFQKFKIDYKKIVERKDEVQNLRYGHHADELKKSTATLIKGKASIIDNHTISVSYEGKETEYTYKYLIIASGSYTFMPEMPGIENAITSRDFFELNPAVKEVPDSIAVIGGGYIGVETASFLSILGSHVELIERSERILMDMDPEIVEKLTPLLPDMTIRLNNEVMSIEKAENGFKLIIKDLNGEKYAIKVGMVMMAAGREPLLPDGLKNAGVEFTHKGICVNSSMQTNIKNIYATGDVNGIAPLFHAAKRESLVAANNILSNGIPDDYFNPKSVPFTLYSIPNMSFVGILPEEAKRSGIKYRKGIYKMVDDTLAEVYNELDGEIDLIFDMNLKIIGGYVIGNDAGNLINEIALGIQKGLTARDYAELAHQHPMTFEGLDTAAREFF
ncbi:MAG: dihydrolipoyl dehydrogenase [Ferroplasma sp.]